MPESRSEIEHGDLLLLNPAKEVRTGRAETRWVENDGCTGYPGRKEFLDGDIETKGRTLRHSVLLRQSEAFGDREIMIHDAAMLDQYAFWLSRRT